MALANVAELLYMVGLKVLMVDWDLEAPGLEQYFPKMDTTVALKQRGVIDLLLSYKEQLLKTSQVQSMPPLPLRREDRSRGEQLLDASPGELKDKEVLTAQQLAPNLHGDGASPAKAQDQEEYAFSFETPDACLINVHSDEKSAGRLWLLTAGRRAGENNFATYAQKVREFDWKDFYDNWGGELYLEFLRQQFERLADVVLIDSRTGVTEIGAVTTYQLADTVVMFCAANIQNLEGVLKMAENFTLPILQELRPDRPLQTLVVPARVEDRAEHELLNKFHADFLKAFTPYTPKELGEDSELLWELKIPYVPFYAFQEVIAVRREEGTKRSDDMVNAFAKLVRALAQIAPTSNPVRARLLYALKNLRQVVRNGVPLQEGAQSEYDGTSPLDTLTEEIGLAAPANVPPPCPYPGMVPYRTEDEDHFYGRAVETRQLLQRLERDSPLLLVVGPSSAGKSSLVFAGLLPQLPRSSRWHSGYWEVLTMKPGTNPLATLRKLVDISVGMSITEAVSTWIETHQPSRRLLLVIDQFEETFTESASPERDEFLTAVEDLVLHAPEICSVLLVLRGDYYSDMLASKLGPLLRPDSRTEITRLTGDALREAIQKPAAELGVQIEPALVERLIADAADEPGSMPLLQETLVLLWGKMEKRQLTLSSYGELGEKGASGLGAAIALKADATMALLPAEKQVIAKRIFLRLVHFRDGRANIPRRQSVEQLRSHDEDPALFDRTLLELVRGRLLILSGEGSSGTQKFVDLAHEALIQSWPTLQEQIMKFENLEHMRRELEQKARVWMEKLEGSEQTRRQSEGRTFMGELLRRDIRRWARGIRALLGDIGVRDAEKGISSLDAAELGYTGLLKTYIEASRSWRRSRLVITIIVIILYMLVSSLLFNWLFKVLLF
jgi:MinD-like ATPase involved in chromosome partitioning or flagellar assembly